MKQFRAWWQTQNDLAQLRIVALGGLGAAAITVSLIALFSGEDLPGLALNLGSELAGAFVTFIIFDLLIGRREKYETEIQETKRLKEDLIADLGSGVQAVAVAAAEQLQRYGWLFDGTLRGVNLNSANLPNSFLSHADLRGADLANAILRNATLVGTCFQEADLTLARLEEARMDSSFCQKAILRGAQLQNASLIGTDLRFADLKGAALRESDLTASNFQEANLESAVMHTYIIDDLSILGLKMAESTILPDGTHWTRDTDMKRFTDPKHPDFWRSDNPDSPAYRNPA